MAKYKVGDKVKVGGHTATIVKILGTSASGEQMYGVKQDDNGWAYESLEGKMKAAANAKFKVGQKVARVSDGKVGVIQEAYADGTYAVHVDGESNPNKMPENRIRAVNADVVNGRHFSGPANDIADKIVKLVNKWLDAPESKKDDAFNRLNTEIRAASSLGGGVWAMRDGTIAIAPEKPRGAQRLTDYLKTLNSKECNSTIKSTNPIVANALNSVKAKNAKFKVGDLVIEPIGGSNPTKIIRVFNLPQDEKKLASEFGGDWKEVRADYMRGKTWYNIERDGKGAFYTDLDLKKVTNASVATNKGIDNQAELRAAADLARALADAKTKVGAALGKFNTTKFVDVKWAQSVNKKCDAVAAAINEARTAIQKGVDY